MVARKSVAVVAAGAVVIAVTVAVLVHVVDRYRSTGPRRDLLLPSLPAPGQWAQSGDLPSYDGEATRTWNRTSDDITELVYGYRSSAGAARAFGNSSPQKTEPDVNGRAQPDDIGVRVPQAEQAQYMCGEYEQGECTTWWAWLRFGDADVMLRYRHQPEDPQALTDDELATVITKAATEIASMSKRD
jgi:hypothetical protein